MKNCLIQKFYKVRIIALYFPYSSILLTWKSWKLSYRKRLVVHKVLIWNFVMAAKQKALTLKKWCKYWRLLYRNHITDALKSQCLGQKGRVFWRIFKWALGFHVNEIVMYIVVGYGALPGEKCQTTIHKC